ncbi:hypothetical protein [Vibrio lentus]|uniref:hypothetical protein n=1 Tax=Vibrio lentus TaxID=136468 RepID=UPI000C81E3BA|nr:hypothetical protein [Vibrio lentus]PMG74837.1 hypothetical protein BCU86_23045 [Vibrio lentus]
MTIVSDLKNIDGLFTTTLLVLFLAVIAPGVLIIYLFLPELFLKLDGLKFVLLSASLSLPIFVLNSLFMPAVMEYDEDEAFDIQQVGVTSGVFSSAVLYGGLLLSYSLNFKFSMFLMAVFIFEIIWILFCLFFMYYKRLQVRKTT